MNPWAVVIGVIFWVFVIGIGASWVLAGRELLGRPPSRVDDGLVKTMEGAQKVLAPVAVVWAVIVTLFVIIVLFMILKENTFGGGPVDDGECIQGLRNPTGAGC